MRRGARGGGQQRPPRPRRRQQLPDDLGHMWAPWEIQSNLLYEALRASRSNVNNGEVLDALFPERQQPPAATALGNDFDYDANVVDDSDFNYLSEAYIPDVMNILSIDNNNDDDDVINDLCVNQSTVLNNSENMSEYICEYPRLPPRIDVISEVTIIDKENSRPKYRDTPARPTGCKAAPLPSRH